MKFRFFFIGSFWMITLSAFSQRSSGPLPDFIVSQVGGSSGFVSTGFGYNALKSKVRLSAHYGVVPRKTGSLLSILSSKIFFHPVELTIWNRLKLNPIDFGVVGVFNTANKIKRENVELKYPNEFWWRNSFQVEGAIQTSVTYEFPKDCFFHSMTGFVEVNVNQSYIRRTLQTDTSLQFRNAIKIGLGTRIIF